MIPNLLVIERILVTPDRFSDKEREAEYGFGAFGLFEHVNDYVLPPGEYATLEATGFDKHGFPKGFEQRKKKPRLAVGQQPASRTLETLK